MENATMRFKKAAHLLSLAFEAERLGESSLKYRERFWSMLSKLTPTERVILKMLAEPLNHTDRIEFSNN
jgi:hypothetical protein